MTGYGRTESQFRGRKIVCEIRSLNSKAMDLTVRLSPALRAQELELRNLVTKRIERGKVDLVIEVQSDEVPSTKAALNWSAAEEYARQYSEHFSTPVPAEVMAAII